MKRKPLWLIEEGSKIQKDFEESADELRRSLDQVTIAGSVYEIIQDSQQETGGWLPITGMEFLDNYFVLQLDEALEDFNKKFEKFREVVYSGLTESHELE